MNVSQLRRKIEPDRARPRYLLTEPGAGYRLVNPLDDAEPTLRLPQAGLPRSSDGLQRAPPTVAGMQVSSGRATRLTAIVLLMYDLAAIAIADRLLRVRLRLLLELLERV